MRKVSDRAKLIYLAILAIFLVVAGLFWLDYIGLIDMARVTGGIFGREAPLVTGAADDEPSLVEREEFEKEKQKLMERIEDLDKREAQIVEAEKAVASEKEKIESMKKGIDLEKKKLENEKKKYAGYEKNVKDLASKIRSIRPEQAVEIMVKWEEPLIIDVLRQIDADAVAAGRTSISSYLISLMPREKASRIMYLMTQI
jgi:flagellar protein FlbB